jgi:predicted transcriptional regulator of viral defense system
MVAYCRAIDSIAVVKRLAYLTELLGKKNMNYFIEYSLSIRNEKYNLFEPNGTSGGSSNRKWRLILNMEPDEILNIANS